MPLIHSSSDAAFKSNLKAELAANKPRDQALAIAYRIKRERRATGGTVTAPTDAQKQAGNYKKDHVRLHGLDIAIENRKGAERSGTDKGGKPWSVKMPAHYGYIKRTEGADGDHVDCYVGPHEKSERVFVVNQHNAETRAFDEHKCMLGFNSAAEARETYKRGFSDGKGHQRLGSMKDMSIGDFKNWLRDGNQKRPVKRADGGKISSPPDEPSRDDLYRAGIATMKTEMNSELGGLMQRIDSKHAQSIADTMPRRRASGGASSPPWFVRNEARSMLHTGPIVSAVGGRTDHHKMSVPGASYVLPADHVSALGQGNTMNGQAVLSRMFSGGPYGSPLPKMGGGKRKFADGGATGEEVPIMAAGGEFVISPEQVAKVGGGDLDHGHRILDRWVLDTRKKHIKTLRKLPGPARD